MARRGRARPAALPGDGDAASGHAAPLGRRQYRLRAQPAPHPPARAPAADRGRVGAHRARRLRARTRARALLRRAAAAGTGALLGAAPAGALPRRADRQSRPGGDPRDRGRDRGDGPGGHQDHHDHPRSRPGAPAGGRGDVLHRGRLLEHAPAAAFFAGPENELASAFLRGELLWWERRELTPPKT